MASLAWPLTENARTYIGFPTTLLIGASKKQFDIHNTLLWKLSDHFKKMDGLPKNLIKPIVLPDISDDLFKQICEWIYDIRTPSYSSPTDLLNLIMLYMTAASLGISSYQNAIIRFIMALCNEHTFEIPVEVVKFVYENTASSSKLRGFITMLFCQRSTPQEAFFEPEIARLGITEDAVACLKILYKVRMMNPQGINGYDLDKEFPMVWNHSKERGLFQMRETRDITHTLDRKRLRFPLPNYLVWGENWESMPDRFFVSAAESAAAEESKQLAMQV
ncbi:hypothetical protein EJ04DRAFT_524856 [Polyplosphaeria fusca]|uniref:BTB domain-containing protein n=1 Tax=Polyplosphaeria fusca TaxID=682080 RepID=A0A9P4V1D0_9PLEO|nr:hypothetical protein EJ04DRAFT_524856 [Polyplosphaeria fusca]